MKIYINIKGYNIELNKLKSETNNHIKSLIYSNKKILDKCEELIVDLRNNGQEFSNLNQIIECDFFNEYTELSKLNFHFTLENKIPKNTNSVLFNSILELISSEDSWIKSIEKTNLPLLTNSMRRNLAIYNSSITKSIYDERIKNIDQLESYADIKSHFHSDFFEIFEFIKNENTLGFFEKTIDEMNNMPIKKINALNTLTLLHPQFDYYGELLSKYDLDEGLENGVRELLFPLKQLTPTAFQRVTRYPMLLQEIEHNLTKVLAANPQENEAERLKEKIAQVLKSTRQNTRLLNNMKYLDEKDQMIKAIKLISHAIINTDWDIKLKTLFGRTEVQSGAKNITSYMKDMLIAIGDINEYSTKEPEEIKNIFATIVSIAKGTETNIRHIILSDYLKKDGLQVNNFYNSIKELDLRPFLATEKVSPFFEPSVTLFEINYNTPS